MTHNYQLTRNYELVIEYKITCYTGKERVPDIELTSVKDGNGEALKLTSDEESEIINEIIEWGEYGDND